jgi:phosphatidylinositol alpha-1,6-mannosyltransferase
MNRNYELLKDRLHLIIHDDVSPDGGGIQNMAYWIARFMEAKGLRVVVGGRIDRKVFKGSGVEVFPLKKPFRTKNTSDIRLLLMLLRLRFRYGRRVVLYSLLINNIKVFRWINWYLKWDCVSFLHGNETLRLLHQKPATLSRSLSICLAVFANSRYTAGLVEKLGPFSNVRVVPPGIPSHRFRDFKPKPGGIGTGWKKRKVILMLSRIVRRKGHETVIKAVAKLREKHPEILLAIAGKGRFSSQILEMVSIEGLQDKVEMLGFVDESDKLAVYSACDVYCMPSEICEEKFDVEGFGITFIEAGAMGKIVIGTRAGGIPDAIEDGRSGFLIDPGDDERLADILDDLFSNPEKYEEILKYGQKRALERFDWDTQTDIILGAVSESIL